jgi:hypothetical protein
MGADARKALLGKGFIADEEDRMARGEGVDGSPGGSGDVRGLVECSGFAVMLGMQASRPALNYTPASGNVRKFSPTAVLGKTLRIVGVTGALPRALEKFARTCRAILNKGQGNVKDEPSP